MNKHQTTFQFHRSTVTTSAELGPPVFLVVVCGGWGQVRPKLPSGAEAAEWCQLGSPPASFLQGLARGQFLSGAPTSPPARSQEYNRPKLADYQLGRAGLREAWFWQRNSKRHAHPKHVGVVVLSTAWQNLCVLIINQDRRVKTLEALFKISIHDTAPTQQYRTIQSLFQIH